MIQKHRIRTEIGKDQKVTVELKQDYDLLEILSLKFTQKDIYTSICADYGVVCGRITANQGYGVANARVSIFIPLDDIDEEDPVVSALYPYRSTQDTDTDGYKYNLFPKRKQHTGHTPTGTFPDQEDILTREEVLYVYEKYYKYTVKTNDAGDFMIWGVPTGSQTIHVDVDLSDMGCQSLVPYDFIYEGVSEERFENNYTFKGDPDIAGLPQTLTFEETVEVYPFWGNEDLCEIGITRTDYDLSDQGIRIEPYSIMMGGSFTDSGKDSVRVKCNVDNQMGEKCNLTTGEGDIEAIRFTGTYEEDSDGTPNYQRPILEAVQLDSQIDQDGNFFFRVPMNMKYFITNEFGELVETKNTQRGIPTRGTYRFRLSYQNDNPARKQYRGKYLVPQIKEHQLMGSEPYTDPKAYAFSTNLDDYPTNALDDITGVNNNGFSNDMFYSFRYNRVYTVSSFLSQYYKQSWGERVFRFFVKDRNESFLGIKEIQPSQEDDCPNTNEYFPINDAVSNFKFKFLITTLLAVLELLYLKITQFLIDALIELIYDLADATYFWPIKKLSNRIAKLGKNLQNATVRTLGLVNYPDCYQCNIDTDGQEQQGGGGVSYQYVTIDDGDEENYITTNGLSPVQTNVSGTHAYDPNQTIGDIDESLTINITGGNTDRNYVLKYVIAEEVIDPNTGNVITPTQYGYQFVGFGSNFPGIASTTLTFDFVMSSIFEDVLIANGYQGSPYPTSVANTAIPSTNNFTIAEIYFISEKTEVTTPVTSVETGCEKYDTIYDPDNDMSLRAYTSAQGSDYSDYASNPNGFVAYPDIFLDGNEDPCSTPTAHNINVSVSRANVENTSIGNIRCRRLAISDGNTTSSSATASGYSEFRDGVYTIIGVAGENQALINDYYQRKLLGKLMCGGITSYTFSNSWLNGALYFFQFRRRRGGNNARYCTDLLERVEDENGVHYYYRSTPYYNGSFIGLSKGDQVPGPEILFPTTIMDMGPRNMFIKEICVDPELDVNCSVSKSIGSTSYNPIDNLMEFILQSKEVKERGRLQAKDLFDRRGSGMIDGDIAQLLNFNSQMGIFGYEEDDDESPYYPTNGQFVYDGYGPVGIDFVFSQDDEDTEIVEKDGTLLRLCINSAGNLTETAQDVPYFRWDKKGDGFGNNGLNSETQDWDRLTIHTTKYQGGWDFTGLMETDPYGGAGGDPTDNINSHYYDGSILPPIRDCSDDNYLSQKIPLGGPFFFYFGLRTGKSSWNKFVKNFGPL